MGAPAILSETFTHTAVRQEADDEDRPSVVLAETHTLTEVRNEVSDDDRGHVLAETQTVTKTTNENSDSDEGTLAGGITWTAGEIRPLLFRSAVPVTAAEVRLSYDIERDIALDECGKPLGSR